MRIAVLSDIHGDRTAFEAVLADLGKTSPDLVLHGGDLADAGASPVEIVDRIRDLGPRAVVITGGHASTFAERDGPASYVLDLLLDGDELHESRALRVDVGPTHGTGCTFASAVAAGLALGRTLPDAVSRAQAYVAGALASRPAVGGGRAVLEHFWQRRSL